MLPHDMAPMGGGGGIDVDDQSFGDQQQGEEGTGPQNNAVTTAGPLGAADQHNQTGAGGGGPLNGTPDNTNSYPGNSQPGGGNAPLQHSNSSSSHQNVDPLSIDPTLYEPSPWPTEISSHHHGGLIPVDSVDTHPQGGSIHSDMATRSRTLGRYLMSMSSTVEQQQGISSHLMGLGTVNSVTTGFLNSSGPAVISPYGSYNNHRGAVVTVASSTVQTPSVGGNPNRGGALFSTHPIPVSRASSSNSASSSSSSSSSSYHGSITSAPLSTGSSVLRTTTAPNSPFSTGANRVTPSILSIVGGPASPASSNPGSPVPIGTSPVSAGDGVAAPLPSGSPRLSRNGSGVRFFRGSRSSTSVLDNSTFLDSDDEGEDDDIENEPPPDLDETNDSGSQPNDGDDDDLSDSDISNSHSRPRIRNATRSAAALNSHHSNIVVTDEDASSASSASGSAGYGSPVFSTEQLSPGGRSTATLSSAGSLQMIRRNRAFDLSTDSSRARRRQQRNASSDASSPSRPLAPSPPPVAPAAPPSSPILLSFGPNTTVSDLKYFAERGCIVALLAALTTPRLKTLGARMLADYAKMPNRRVAVASNRRILEFVQRTMLDLGNSNNGGSMQSPSSSDEDRNEYASPDWLGREYSVETVRSLTATEESDGYLMSSPGLLKTLALIARGGPFITALERSPSLRNVRSRTVPLASGKARLHACIAIMNLSCGKANKIEIAKIPEVLEAMRDVMVGAHFAHTGGNGGAGTADEARLKATTCIKNLSNADANDGALLGTPGLVEALGHVAAATCAKTGGATPCTTNACLALMNLSISKANKHRVFRTPGVMEGLMAVITRTSPPNPDACDGESPPPSPTNPANSEARIKACSALSNLAIGYDNKIPMFAYPGFVDAILHVIDTDDGEARTKACSILWSFAAEMKNQVPVVQRGDILPTLVRVAEEDRTTEARFKCVAALTLLAESLENAIPLLESGALAPLMEILHEAGPDPTQWQGQTASWCVGFLMNIAQSDEAVPSLREAGVVELLAPLLTLDHYQSLKAAMAVTFVCRYDEGDETYDLLRKTENVIPKIISLLHNTLSGRGGNGYKYGVFTLRSSVGCISSLASGPDFMKERIATCPVFESLLRVLSDFCVDGGTPGAIVGGGRDDALSATLAIRALQSLTAHLIPIPGSSSLPFGRDIDLRLLTAVEAFEVCTHPEVSNETRRLATDAKVRIQASQKPASNPNRSTASNSGNSLIDDAGDGMGSVCSLAQSCCGLDTLPSMGQDFLRTLSFPQYRPEQALLGLTTNIVEASGGQQGMEVIDVEEPGISASSVTPQFDGGNKQVRTFLLTDSRTGRRFAVPTDPSGGRAFNDTRVWCYRRGRFCLPGEVPDPNFRWTDELQAAYVAALARHRRSSSPTSTSGTASPSQVPSQGQR